MQSSSADTSLKTRKGGRDRSYVEKPVTHLRLNFQYRGLSMAASTNNVIPFPLHRRHDMHGCPICGKRDDVWQIGRLLWGYCEPHELRWVVADHKAVSRATINRRELRRGLEFLSAFVEVSR